MDNRKPQMTRRQFLAGSAATLGSSVAPSGLIHLPPSTASKILPLASSVLEQSIAPALYPPLAMAVQSLFSFHLPPNEEPTHFINLHLVKASDPLKDQWNSAFSFIRAGTKIIDELSVLQQQYPDLDLRWIPQLIQNPETAKAIQSHLIATNFKNAFLFNLRTLSPRPELMKAIEGCLHSDDVIPTLRAVLPRHLEQLPQLTVPQTPVRWIEELDVPLPGSSLEKFLANLPADQRKSLCNLSPHMEQLIKAAGNALKNVKTIENQNPLSHIHAEGLEYELLECDKPREMRPVAMTMVG